ncbi:cation diffusion facilitator family transporter [Leptolyngbya subtilissima]|uniref:Cation diffusion facilitator family transporter n=2 Tax=Cyanophyceae TaxID=3028117 RepID=A0ABV0K0P6_9CYAN
MEFCLPMNEGEYQRRISYRLLLTTLWATLLLLAVQAIGGWASQSLTLLAESLHTLVDGFSTVLSLVAVTSPQRQMGREVWGHGRAEVAGTLILCAFLGFTGVSLLLIALRQLLSGLTGGATPFPVAIDSAVLRFTAAMVILNVALGIYASYQARSLSSQALKLNTRHFLADAWLSIVMVGVLLAIWQGQRWLDPLFALVLLPLVGRSLWRVLNEQLPMLLRPTAIAPEAISHIATQVEGVTRCTRIRSRGMVGRQVWIEIHLVLHPEFVESAEIIGEQIDAQLRHRYGPLRTQVWVESARPYQDAFMEPGMPNYLPPSSNGGGSDWG